MNKIRELRLWFIKDLFNLSFMVLGASLALEMVFPGFTVQVLPLSFWLVLTIGLAVLFILINK